MAIAPLEISKDIVGTRAVPLDIDITPRMIMNYAAGIGDDNPWHFADDRPEGIVAPPMMTWALTWRFSSNRAFHWPGSGISPELGSRGVHYTEELIWDRPLVPGDKLHIEGQIVELMAHRSGTCAVSEYIGTDAKGERVFTERIGSLMRGVTCAEALEEFPSGRTLFDAPAGPARTLKLPVHRLAAHIYDGCADIHNPIHTSKAFALAVGLPDIILHGTATLACAVRDITNTEGEADPRRVKKIACAFTGMVFMETEVELQVLGTRATEDATEVHFQVLNDQGQKAIRNGCVTFAPKP